MASWSVNIPAGNRPEVLLTRARLQRPNRETVSVHANLHSDFTSQQNYETGMCRFTGTRWLVASVRLTRRARSPLWCTAGMRHT